MAYSLPGPKFIGPIPVGPAPAGLEAADGGTTYCYREENNMHLKFSVGARWKPGPGQKTEKCMPNGEWKQIDD